MRKRAEGRQRICLRIFSWAIMKESGYNCTMVLQYISTVDMWMTHFACSTTKRMLWNFSIISTIYTLTLHSPWRRRLTTNYRSLISPEHFHFWKCFGLDYEQSLCFLIVRRERNETNRPRESWPRESCCLGERRKKKGLQTKPQRLTFHGRVILWCSFQI